jgi:hypothetical protein
VEALLKHICALVPGAGYFVHGATPGDQSGIYAATANLKACLDIGGFTQLDEGLLKFAQWARGVVVDPAAGVIS